MAILEAGLALAAVSALGAGERRDPATLPASKYAGWVHPLPTWRGYKPTVSDFFQAAETKDHRQHLGVDLMYQRKNSDKVTGPEEPFDDVNGSKGFFVPKGMVAVACHDGEIWSTGESDLGFNVVLDLGTPFAVFYQHLSTLFVPLGIKRGKKGDSPWPIRAGEPLGIVGGGRKGYGLRHLHLEVWKGGDRSHAIDPRAAGAPADGLSKWTVIEGEK